VQYDGAAGSLPVGEHLGHVVAARRRTDHELGVVTDGPLLGVDLFDVGAHRLRCDLHITHTVVGERFRIGLPHADGMRHQLSHCGLKVVVADDPARHARGARAHAGLVDHQNVPAVALPGGAQASGEVPRSRQAMDAGADDYVARVFGHAAHLEIR
jgi:hypothetical protein